jgi:hypothetical protein
LLVYECTPIDRKTGFSGAHIMRKVWIEAALNGGWSRALQPGVPAFNRARQTWMAGASPALTKNHF